MLGMDLNGSVLTYATWRGNAGDVMYWWNGVVVTRSVRLGRWSSARVAWCCSEKQRNDRWYGRLGQDGTGKARNGMAG